MSSFEKAVNQRRTFAIISHPDDCLKDFERQVKT